MPAQNATNWMRVGLFALPVSGALIAWSSLDPQPDQAEHPEAWARFVGSNHYLLTHVFGSMGSALLAILGVFALGAYLANGRAGRLGLAAMVVTVVGQALSLVIGGVSTFALNAIGRAYLAGVQGVMRLEFSSAMSVLFGLAILLLVVGNVLLGVAVWRSGTLPRWAGAAWVASALVFYVFGAVLGMATTGASLPTQPLGGLLMVAGGGWMAWSVLRRPSAEAVGVQAQPSVP
ncbi:MAG TPA: hypothetical protein VKA73_06365 [Rubrobacter sp.]|nr:hypothetical protein [Rubrobacter sp.]